jgi:hypothetical protein
MNPTARKKPNRILNRRHDPLRRLTTEDWRRRLSRFTTVTDALICACSRLFFDYAASAPATADIRAQYRYLARLPPRDEIRACLLRLGYPPVQAERAVHSYGQTYRVRDQGAVNRRDWVLRSLSREPDGYPAPEIHLPPCQDGGGGASKPSWGILERFSGDDPPEKQKAGAFQHRPSP